MGTGRLFFCLIGAGRLRVTGGNFFNFLSVVVGAGSFYLSLCFILVVAGRTYLLVGFIARVVGKLREVCVLYLLCSRFFVCGGGLGVVLEARVSGCGVLIFPALPFVRPASCCCRVLRFSRAARCFLPLLSWLPPSRAGKIRGISFVSSMAPMAATACSRSCDRVVPSGSRTCCSAALLTRLGPCLRWRLRT